MDSPAAAVCIVAQRRAASRALAANPERLLPAAIAAQEP